MHHKPRSQCHKQSYFPKILRAFLETMMIGLMWSKTRILLIITIKDRDNKSVLYFAKEYLADREQADRRMMVGLKRGCIWEHVVLSSHVRIAELTVNREL